MIPFVKYAPYLVVLGIGLFAIAFTVFVNARTRRIMQRIGASLVIIGLFGVIILLKSAPGREQVIEEDRKDWTPPPRETLTIQEKLELPWHANEPSDWPAAEALAQLCKTSYQEPVDARSAFEGLGFKSETITAASMIGYVLASGETAVVLLRGTDDSPDWVRNASFLSSRTKRGSIHSGFYNAYQPLHAQIEKLLQRFSPKRVWITGHSLGGALAIVASYQLDIGNKTPIVGVMTFGQPMVVGSDLKAFLKPRLEGKYVHFVNEADPVARLVTPFEHFGTLIWLKDGVILRSDRKLVSYGSHADQNGVVPAFQSMSIDELEKLKADLERAEEAPRARGANEGPMPVGAFLPSVSDHNMDQYIRMIKTISDPRMSLEEMPVREE